MAGCINQIEYIFRSFKFIIDLNGMAFYGNSFLAFQVHIIQYLRLHIPVIYRMCKFQQPVGQSTFAMINMSYYTKISYILHLPKIFKKGCKGNKMACFNYLIIDYLNIAGYL